MNQFFQDLRYGLRMLWRSPGFTIIAVLTLGLGIGANTATFSTVNAIVLRPLPFTNLDQIVTVWETQPKAGHERYRASFPNFLDWKDQTRIFQQMAAYRGQGVNLTGVGDPEAIPACLVSSDFFTLLGMEPVLGRKFSVDETQPGHERVALLSYGFWQKRLGADPQVVGRTLALDGRDYTVVGVMPSEFDFPLATQMWLPLAPTPDDRTLRGARNLLVLGRLEPGVSLDQARAEMSTLAARLSGQYADDTGWGVQLVLLRHQIVFGTRQFLIVLMAASCFVLLLACANVANLQLARAAGRQKEMSIRGALGAGRFRVVRQLLTESLLLSLLGAGLGLLLAMWGVGLMRASVPEDIVNLVAGLKHADIDGRVLVFTMLSALLTAIVSGLAPAVHTSSPNLNQGLREGSSALTAGTGRGRIRSLLVISEVALAVVLLVGAGLMVKGFRNLLNTYPGFQKENLLTMRISLPPRNTRKSARWRHFSSRFWAAWSHSVKRSRWPW